MKKDTTWAEALILILVGLPVILGIRFFAGGALLYLAWNYGVAAVTAVPHLAIWPACFISLGFGLLHGTLSRRSA